MSKSNSFTIEKAIIDQVGQIAKLHYKFIFPESQKDKRQEKNEIALLDAYYHELVRRNDSLVYVACNRGRVLGYCSLVSNQKVVMVMVALKHFRVFLRALFFSQKHSYINYGWHKLLAEGFGKKWQGIDAFRGGIEIRSIAVEKMFRTENIASHLLSAIVQEAHLRHWNNLIAWVQEENMASRRLFEKIGFRKLGEKREGANDVVWLYSLLLEKSHEF